MAFDANRYIFTYFMSLLVFGLTLPLTPFHCTKKNSSYINILHVTTSTNWKILVHIVKCRMFCSILGNLYQTKKDQQFRDFVWLQNIPWYLLRFRIWISVVSNPNTYNELWTHFNWNMNLSTRTPPKSPNFEHVQLEMG